LYEAARDFFTFIPLFYKNSRSARAKSSGQERFAETKGNAGRAQSNTRGLRKADCAGQPLIVFTIGFHERDFKIRDSTETPNMVFLLVEPLLIRENLKKTFDRPNPPAKSSPMPKGFINHAI